MSTAVLHQNVQHNTVLKILKFSENRALGTQPSHAAI
jgi:hypothetical protein